jgi:hypothetical protein
MSSNPWTPVSLPPLSQWALKPSQSDNTWQLDPKICLTNWGDIFEPFTGLVLSVDDGVLVDENGAFLVPPPSYVPPGP